MSNIKQCQNCQTEVQPGAGFCTNCGERLQGILNCNSCGAQLQQGWKACPDCGNKVQTKQGLSEDQARIATVVKEKIEKAEEKFGSDVADVKLSKQPQAFGNPQDDELKRGSKKDNAKWSESVELELEKFIADLNNKRGSILDEINIRKSNTVESLIRRY